MKKLKFSWFHLEPAHLYQTTWEADWLWKPQYQSGKKLSNHFLALFWQFLRCKTSFLTSRTDQMVFLIQVIQSTGPGGSGYIEFLKIPSLVQKLLSFEVEPGFAQQFAHWKFVCCRQPSLVGCKYFQKNLNYTPGARVSAQLTTQVMFIHLKTPFGDKSTINYPSDQEIEKHRKILGLVCVLHCQDCPNNDTYKKHTLLVKFFKSQKNKISSVCFLEHLDSLQTTPVPLWACTLSSCSRNKSFGAVFGPFLRY